MASYPSSGALMLPSHNAHDVLIRICHSRVGRCAKTLHPDQGPRAAETSPNVPSWTPHGCDLPGFLRCDMVCWIGLGGILADCGCCAKVRDRRALEALIACCTVRARPQSKVLARHPDGFHNSQVVQGDCTTRSAVRAAVPIPDLPVREPSQKAHVQNLFAQLLCCEYNCHKLLADRTCASL